MEGGFLTPRKSSAASLVVVIALHGAALTALALSKMDMPIKEYFPPIIIDQIPVDPIPPEVPPEPKPQPKAAPRSDMVAVDPIVDTDTRSIVETELKPPVTPPVGPGAIGKEVTITDGKGDPVVTPPLVRIAAQVDPRYADALQPPYPPSEQRMSNEGKVSVRVTIGTDGRVKAVRRVSATSDAFYKATERQALNRWRFKAATVDGKPVESEKVMTVTFQMER